MTRKKRKKPQKIREGKGKAEHENIEGTGQNCSNVRLLKACCFYCRRGSW